MSVGGVLGRQSKRWRLASSPPFRPADLDHAREELHADRAALAEAKEAVAVAEANRDAIDADLDPQQWHLRRAELEESVVAAVREVERLDAAVEHRRLSCLSVVHAIMGAPIDEAQARMTIRRDRMAVLSSELASLDREQADDEAVFDSLSARRDEAAQEFVTGAERYAHGQAERNALSEAAFALNAKRLGYDVPVSTGARRYVHTPQPSREEQEAAAVAHSRATYPPEGIGVTRLNADGSGRLS